MKISVVVPAYNESSSIGLVVEEVRRTLEDITDSWEILIVDDGSNDPTYLKAKKLEELYNGKVKALTYQKNRGKGFALKYGFQHSTGDLIVFMDADMDLHPGKIKKFVEIMEKEKADVVVGSKKHPESKVDYPFKRRILSDAYFLMVKILFNLNVKDTQVGLKLFKREVLGEVIPRILVKRYAFDVEVLANAVRRGYKIVEAPVELEFKHNSNINWKEIWRMFVDTSAIAYRMHIRRYYD